MEKPQAPTLSDASSNLVVPAKKYCKRCDSTLPVEKFTKSVGRYDGLQAYCRECMKKYRIEYYRQNKESHQKRNKKKCRDLRNYILRIKETTPCTDCGVVYPEEPWLTEFDHVKEKTDIISRLVTSGSLKRLQAELENCELRCLICHRRKSAERGEWRKNRFEDSA